MTALLDKKKSMYNAIKTIVIPSLRKKGFKGSLPYFRRHTNGYIDLLTFQNSSYGGRFCIEIGKYTSKGVLNPGGKIIPPEKVKTSNLSPFDKRPRLSPTMKGDYWFIYEKSALFSDVYQKLAKEVLSLIGKQAEEWWADKNNLSANAP